MKSGSSGRPITLYGAIAAKPDHRRVRHPGGGQRVPEVEAAMEHLERGIHGQHCGSEGDASPSPGQARSW